MTTKHEHYREFSAEHAKAGAPYCCIDGKEATIDDLDSAQDLIMLPLGMCEGKPVFTGDLLEYNSGTVYSVDPWPRSFTNLRWPAQFTHPNFTASEGVFYDADGNEFKNPIDIANAALRHAVETGQVITKEAHEAAIERLAEAQKKRDHLVAQVAHDSARYEVQIKPDCVEMRTTGMCFEEVMNIVNDTEAKNRSQS